MDMASGLMSALYMISTSLLYPVILLLLGLIGWSMMLLGSFISEYSTRNRDIKKIKKGCIVAKKYINIGEFSKAVETLKNCGSNYFIANFINELTESIKETTFLIESEKLLHDYEIKIAKELEKTRLVARIGPMLGLMGTLIPMGPALIGLASGNIQQLANNLVIAFSTTVLGLMVGGIGYGISLIKKRWYIQDLSDMEYIVDMLKFKGDESEKTVYNF